MAGFLVAAGVVLRGDQHQPRARRLGLRLPADCVQDAHEGRVSGENSETYGGDYGEAENERHEERDHLSLTLTSAVSRSTFRLFESLLPNPAPNFLASHRVDAQPQ